MAERAFFGHKDIKDIFSVGVFLDKKTDSLRHKDKKNIFSAGFSEDIKTKRIYFLLGFQGT